MLGEQNPNADSSLPGVDSAVMEFDAVLPLTKADSSRARMLLYSLGRHVSCLRKLFVVCPEEDLDAIRADLPACVPLEFVGELDLLPDLRHYKRLRKLKPKSLVYLAVAYRFRGWMLQQIIKLAIAERVQTPYYLTLDADVIAARPIDPAELFREGRALCMRFDRPAMHQLWYHGTERYFGLPKSPLRYGVTPTLLAKEGVECLIPFVLANARRTFWRRIFPLYQPRSWHGLLSQVPTWTEYSLYFSALHHLGQLERLHFPVERNPYYLDSVMDAESWSSFSERYLTSKGPPRSPFTVIQSTIGVSDAEVWKVIRPRCFPDSPAEWPFAL